MSCEEKLDDMMLVLLWIKEQVQIRQVEQKVLLENQEMILKQQEALNETINSACKIKEDVRALRSGMKNC